MSFDMPGNMPHFKGNKKGRAYLTTHRVRMTDQSLEFEQNQSLILLQASLSLDLNPKVTQKSFSR